MKYTEHLISRLLIFGITTVLLILLGFPTILLLMFGGGGGAEELYETETFKVVWKLSALMLLLPIIVFKFFIYYRKGQSSKARNYAFIGLSVMTITLLFAAYYNF